MAEIGLKSEVAGRVWLLARQEGDEVAAQEAVVIVEAMKMEIPVISERSGKVVKLLVSEGDEVAEDQTVAIIDVAP
ncbi:acetyl-CoA carboxylase biotin carboxyl carrier protein subunit [Paracoccus alkanivorans]|uniref:Biotin/lipoyl-binding protein n=1 Tax=Paracoccus alkanivorans TaxID=2116655 RepID=A0A3M0MJF9_9RHOB|nr:acetyl-CoA carboxylase biotin carboxyl carrier protein subunit [Paracoccus alkanivorans]RMC37585.1 biotin/lipoyl-binding protein [Paracoccus alkanivorans]